MTVATREANHTGFDPIPPETPLPRIQNTERPDETPEAALDHLKSELDYEILEMKRVLRKGGLAVWRSAAKRPWYRQRFELAGFKGEYNPKSHAEKCQSSRSTFAKTVVRSTASTCTRLVSDAPGCGADMTVWRAEKT